MDGEWRCVVQSPMMASLALTVAEPSGLWGLISEGIAATGPLREALRADEAPEIVKLIVEDLKTSAGRSTAQDGVKATLRGKQPPEARDAAVMALAEAASIVDAKAPAETAAFKAWLKDIAQKVAEAAKEGGFLGFGGERVSAAERATLADIDRALGLA